MAANVKLGSAPKNGIVSDGTVRKSGTAASPAGIVDKLKASTAAGRAPMPSPDSIIDSDDVQGNSY